MIGGGFISGKKNRYRFRYRDPSAAADTFVDSGIIRGNLTQVLKEGDESGGEPSLSPELYFQFDNVQAGGDAAFRRIISILESTPESSDLVDSDDGVGGESGNVILQKTNEPVNEWIVERYESTESDDSSLARVWLGGKTEVRPYVGGNA